MRLLSISFLVVVFLASLACSNQKQSPEEIKEKTAQATQDLKQNVKAVAEGVKEGWSKDQRVNLNTASKADLMSLPGMTSDWADGIVGGRPYYAPGDLLKNHVVPRAEYNRIADRITTSGAKPNPGM
jgi:DNA uptake protein ComE-like DNA-binding protein